MSHRFDTGLPQPQRTALRRGTVALLSDLKRPRGYLRDVLSFGGVVRTYTDEPDIQLLIKAMGATPSIAVQLATRDYENKNVNASQAISEIQLLLYHASQHSRDLMVGRHEADTIALVDDHADPGLDIMMEHALELLHGQYASISTTVKSIRIKREEELATLPEITIWLQTYQVRLQSYTGSKEFRTADELLTSIGWRVTSDPNEPGRPAPATSSTTVDADTDLET